MSSRNLNIIIIGLLFVGFLLSSELAYRNFMFGDICPKIANFPACYLALFYFIILLFLQIFHIGEGFFIYLSGFAVALAIFTSLGHLISTITCPMTRIQLPLCYIVLIIFGIIIGLKFLEVKINKPQ